MLGKMGVQYCGIIPDLSVLVKRLQISFISHGIMYFDLLGNASGSISLRDPRTLREEHNILAHTASLSDFDVHNNFLVTCGFSSRYC